MFGRRLAGRDLAPSGDLRVTTTDTLYLHALLPIFARDILHVGPVGLGFLRCAPAVGAFATAFYLTHWPIRQKVGPVMFASVAVFGVATIVFGLSTWFPVSLLALVVLGASDMVSV